MLNLGVVIEGGYKGIPGLGDGTADDRNPGQGSGFFETILSGDFDDNDNGSIPLDQAPNPTLRSENSLTVVNGGAFTDSTTAIDGVTIRDGNGGQDDPDGRNGAGVFVPFNSSPTIVNCVITRNSVPNIFPQIGRSGGGIYVIGTNDRFIAMRIEDCLNIDNLAGEGGGAVTVKFDAATLRMTDCTFIDNRAEFVIGQSNKVGGGGLFVCKGGFAEVRRCRFENNQAIDSRGGGVSVDGRSSVFLLDSQFVINQATNPENGGGLGGGVFLDNISAQGRFSKIIDCVFEGNTATSGQACTPGAGICASGGGVYLSSVFGNRHEVVNSLFFDNSAQEGGGLYANFSGTDIVNCTLSENNATSLGGGIHVFANFVELEVKNCILWNNTDVLSSTVQDEQIAQPIGNGVAVTYSCIQDDTAGDGNIPFGGMGNGNIDDDPSFVDSASNNFRLTKCSPSIDAGNTPPVPADAHNVDEDTDKDEKTPDLDLSIRVFWTPGGGAGIPEPPAFPAIVDMGAYEFQGVCEPGLCLERGDGNGDGVVNGLDIQAMVNCLLGATPLCECICLDMNADGEVNVMDIDCFIEKKLDPLNPSFCEAMYPCPDGFLPQEASADCNNNGVSDYVDISTGTSQDCNGNRWPDECEQDCNGNGVPDDCDVDPSDPDGNHQVSQDCNSNGFPDECDLTLFILASPDCNGNGVPDGCDIRSGTSQDCNRNGIPDECDIASGTSPDGNGNGIPDECELGQG